jgi:hypothetical protein
MSGQADYALILRSCCKNVPIHVLYVLNLLITEFVNDSPASARDLCPKMNSYRILHFADLPHEKKSALLPGMRQFGGYLRMKLLLTLITRSSAWLIHFTLTQLFIIQVQCRT